MATMTALVGAVTSPARTSGAELLTVAEASGYTRTASYDEVIEFAEKLAASSRNVTLSELGRSHGGKSLPLLVLADPPVRTAREAIRTGKPVSCAKP